MSTRPLVAAEHREVTGKQVAQLRRRGLLPGVVYGHGHASEAIQIDAHEFGVLRRHVRRNALLDLKVGSSKVTPVLLQHVQEHPIGRQPIHVDFYVVKMSEELTLEVPIALVGESDAVEKHGGTLLYLRDSVQVRALPADLPSVIELDVSSLETFEAVLHVSDLLAPARVQILSDGDEPVARVQPPRVELEPVIAAEVEAPAAEAEAAAGAEPGAESASGARPASEG